MILYVRSTSRSREQNKKHITQREHAKGLFILLSKQQDCMFIKHGRHNF